MNIIRKHYKNVISWVLVFVSTLIIISILNLKVEAAEEMLQEPLIAEMNTNTEYNIVLDENPTLRWNVDGILTCGADVHLNNSSGENCNFKFFNVLDKEKQSTEYYGIKYMAGDGKIDRFVDAEDKKTNIGAKLHVWNDSNYSEAHQQFKFYYQGTNSAGEMLYYIQIKKSGHWLGLNDNNDNGVSQEGEEVAQVSESDRKLWRITAGKGQSGEELATSKNVHITLVDDLSLRWNADNQGGFEDAIHLDDLNGSNCEFKLCPTGDGFYGIKFERENAIDFFVDVSGDNNTVNKTLHLWSDGNYAQTNRQFSFHEAGINEKTGRMAYYIQARHSGLWIGMKDNKVPNAKADLAQVNKSERLAFYVTDVENTVERDERLRYWDAIPLDSWMEHLRDDTKLNAINMPGTHDSATKYVGFQNLGSNCQSYNIREQLDIGIRFLDIRLKKDDGRYILCHNFCDAYYTLTYITELEFEKHVLEEYVYQFLKEHPSETIVMSIKEDDGNTDNASCDMGKALKEIIDKNPTLWYTENRIPELSEVRGKIVLASRIKNTVTDYEGLDLSDWQSEDLYTTKLYSDNSGTYKAHIQDEYCGGRITFHDQAKWNTYESVLKMAEYKMVAQCDLIINFASANNIGHKPHNGPRYYAHCLNAEIRHYHFQYGVQYGWQIWDFPDTVMTRNLISSNNFASNMIVDLEALRPGARFDFLLPDFRLTDNTGRTVKFDLYSDEERTNLLKSYSHTMTENTLTGFKAFGYVGDVGDELQLVIGNDYYISVYETEMAGVPASGEVKFKFTYLPYLTGDITITGNAVYGETLTATLGETNNTGELYYVWQNPYSEKLTPAKKDNKYTITERDIGTRIKVYVYSNKEIGNKVSILTSIVEKADGITPSAPTLNKKTETSITLNTVEGQEYKLGDGTWQDSGEFTGLTANIEYKLYTRAKETSTHKISAVSEALIVTTSVAHNVTATAGENGSISLNGNNVVEYNDEISFTITPESGYQLDKVTVDGTPVDGVVYGTNSATYTIRNVTTDMEINVTFKAITHTVTVTSDVNGMISPSGDLTVNEGDWQTYKFIPNAGYEIDEVTLNGTEVTLYGDEYTLTEITEDIEIEVTFKEYVEPTLPSVEEDNQTTILHENKDVIFRILADFTEFNGLEYNGDVVAPANYTAVEGSIIITLKGEYVANLTEGTHVFTAIVGDFRIPLNLIVEEVITETYKVSYDDGVDGEIILVPIDTNKYKISEDVKVSETALVREGYMFLGFKDLSVANTPVEIKEGKFKMPNRDVVLVAKWEKESTVNPTSNKGDDNATSTTPPSNKGDNNSTSTTPPSNKGDDNATSTTPPSNKGDDNSTSTTSPSNKGDDNATSTIPQSGDNKNVLILLVLFVLSLGIIRVTISKRKIEK